MCAKKRYASKMRFLDARTRRAVQGMTITKGFEKMIDAILHRFMKEMLT